MRNVENIRRVANAIEKNGKNRPVFDITQWAAFNLKYIEEEPNVCNTAACIAGYTVFEFYPETFLNGVKKTSIKTEHSVIKQYLTEREKTFYPSHRVSHYRLAKEILGLTDEEAHNLFMTSMDVTKEDAVKFLRYIADNPDYKIPPYWNG